MSTVNSSRRNGRLAQRCDIRVTYMRFGVTRVELCFQNSTQDGEVWVGFKECVVSETYNLAI